MQIMLSAANKHHGDAHQYKSQSDGQTGTQVLGHIPGQCHGEHVAYEISGTD